MLGLGNTLSGGIVPAAAVASLTNEYSIDFDGVDDGIVCGTATWDYGTFGAWVKTTDTGWGYVLTKAGSFGDHEQFYIAVSDGVIKMRHPIRDGLNNNYDAGINDGNWHHLVVVVSGGSGDGEATIKYYVDGSLVATFTNTGQTYTNNASDPCGIGYYNAWNEYLGQLDEVSIWNNVALDADAVAAIYNSGTPIDLSSNSGNYTSSSALTHWWRMGDDDTYPTIEDNAGSLDGTMTNMVSGDIVSDTP